MKEGKTILITGGCGYIGSHTAIDLLQKGFEVISIDNFSRSRQFIPERIKKITGKDFINYRLDCCDMPKLRSVISGHPGIIGIIHFAAFKSVGESVRIPLIYYDNNLNSTINLLRIADEFNIPHFVFSSSCSVYGNANELPVREDTSISTPESPYAWTKLISEQMIKEHAVNSNINFIILRYFNPVGAHESATIGEIPFADPENLVPNITQTAIGKKDKFVVYGNDYPTRDGSCIRDYVHVMDIAEAHTLALQYLIEKTNTSNFEIFNLGSGEGYSVLELIHAFEKISGVKLNYEIGERRTGDVISVYADNKKAYQILHWNLKRNIDEMMRSAWDWEKQLKKEIIT
ncbi:MAG: UDP-glucose 4-epimerase GalE [Fimbriimonadaceae bacterium]|nr:UDP-glucose 4-epimerase GalE [Chitinophagales bacterium]